MTERQAGILAHPTSLPSDFGVGDLGPSLTRFLDWLKLAGQSIWQVLPMGPAGPGESPYDSPSAFAGNPLVISPDLLVEGGILRQSDLTIATGSDPRDPWEVARWKESVLRRAWQAFTRRSRSPLHDDLDRYVEENRPWLDDWALFRSLKNRHDGKPWNEWDASLARRDPSAIESASRELSDEIAFHRWVQFVFFQQWHDVRAAARDRGISILGDVPIYVAIDSADVWAHQDLFHLDDDGRPTVVAGVPPDYFSGDGQRWGNPIYRWERMAEDGYAWWIDRLRSNLRLADLVRLDHFRGFAGYWEIPASERTARSGRWVEGPGDHFFTAVRDAIGSLPFIAEDLGTITADVIALRARFGLPSMRVLQFAFGHGDNVHLPSRYDDSTVAYTGTHDNDTTRGWFDSLDPTEQKRVRDLVGDGDVVDGLISVLYESDARIAIVPLQDALGLGSEARMNRPGVTRGNWIWRADAAMIAEGRAENLRALVSRARRGPESNG